jgi:hypothetical protein
VGVGLYIVEYKLQIQGSDRLKFSMDMNEVKGRLDQANLDKKMKGNVRKPADKRLILLCLQCERSDVQFYKLYKFCGKLYNRFLKKESEINAFEEYYFLEFDVAI